MVGRTDLVVSWVVAVLFLLTGVWPALSSAQFFLPGFEAVSSHGTVAKWFQIGAIFLAVLWMSFPIGHSRDRFLIFRGVALALAVQGFLYIGIPFGLGFAVLHSVAVRAGNSKMA